MVKLSLTLVILGVTLPAVSARYKCSCSKNKYRDIGGIDNVCDGLGNNWESRDCDLLRSNCYTCVYDGPRPIPDDDYNELRRWCEGVLAGDRRDFHTSFSCHERK
ncbi:hypothetical protein F5Y10DRAFT_247748 [Nemania abortiva]|nr:hypothetical protein F5Y10DRAFT_247748 [Nemania abortiva]